MSRTFARFAIVTAIALMPAIASAQSAIQLSLFNPVQLVEESASVSGLSLGLLYTVNDDVTGSSWTMVANRLTGDLKGTQEGIVNVVEGSVEGIQSGFVNLVNGNLNGWQNGLANINARTSRGVMLGILNHTASFRGFQLGLINMTQSLYGLQIGLVNINQGGPYPVLPIANWSF